MNLFRSKRGYMLLLMVLTVGTVASASAVAIILLGIGVERNAFALQLSTQAYAGAGSCAELALTRLRSNLEYRGNESISLPYGYIGSTGSLVYGNMDCTIYPVMGGGNDNRTVCTEALFGNFTVRRMEIVVSRVLPDTRISSWQEVQDITSCSEYEEAVCGDNDIQLGEECDDGGTSDGDGCSSICEVEYCGDSVIQAGLGETCDDGAESASCDSDCTARTCGDGTLNATGGEACDDGNGTNLDGCSSACAVEAPGPTDYVSYWKLDETDEDDDAVDEGASSYDGDPQSGATVITSSLAPLTFSNVAARDFDGSNDYVRMTNNSALMPNAMTVSFWWKNDVTPANYDGMVCKTNGTSGNKGYGFYYYGGAIRFFVERISNNYASRAIPSVTTWTHYAGTYNHTTGAINVYVNGVAGTAGTNYDSLEKGENFEIGRCGSNSVNINGKVDDVRVYNRVLTLTEIQTLANGR